MLEWTGERFLPWREGVGGHYEHLHRYAFACQFARGKKVLDLATGEGYGAYMLSQEADYVCGIDIDEQTIRHASGRYLKDNLEFIRGSMLEVPVDGEKKFDLITCFEGIEHISEHERFLSEVKRLLKDDGLFIGSTPNKLVYNDEPGFHNPFHQKELYFDEFRTLFNRYFKSIHFLGQRVYAGSNLWNLSPPESVAYREFVVRRDEKAFHFTESSRKAPVYFIVLASDVPLEPFVPNIDSWLVDASDILFKDYQRRIDDLSNVIQDYQRRIDDLSNVIQKSVIIQLLNRYQRVIESLLHQGTRRRHYYELILSGLRVILNEGWGSWRWLKANIGTRLFETKGK